MIGKLELFSLKLDRNNTMYFNNEEEQKEFFNKKVLKTIDEISFNGSRPFRFSSNYLIPTFLPYNYCRFTFENKQGNGNFTIYCFIDDIQYDNDNTCTLVTSYDVIQTFMFKIFDSDDTFANVKNLTLKNKDFNNYISFTNKITPNDYNIYKISDFSYRRNGKMLCYIMLNVDNNFFITNNNIGYNLYEYGYESEICCVCVPMIYDPINDTFETTSFIYKDNDPLDPFENTIVSGYLSLKAFEVFGANIMSNSVGVIYDRIPNINWTADNVLESQPYQTDTKYKVATFKNIKDNQDYNFLVCYSNPRNSETISIDLTPYLPSNRALQRTPYVSLQFGNNIDNFTINLLDFYGKRIPDENNLLQIRRQQSFMYPYQSLFTLYFRGNPITDIKSEFLITPIEPIPYSVSAWQQYYATNKATINDGLATAHKYEEFNIEKSLNAGMGNALGNFVIGGITFATSSGYITGQNIGAGRMISAVTDANNTITRYQISKNNLQKEKALQEIGWNDIKSSPSTFSNLSSNFVLRNANRPQTIEILIYVAKNINDINNFHKKYGYAINREEYQYFKQLKRHNVFDYISFNEVDFDKELPLAYKEIIEQVLENGVRFWYDYNTFLNYITENTEIGE